MKQKIAFVSVIIPALNEEKNIERCFKSLLEMDTPVDDYEVVLVDNGSTDRTIEIAGSFIGRLNLTILQVPGVKIAKLRNIGVQRSKGDILAFVDADCTVCASWVNNAVKYFDIASIGAVGSSCNVPQNYSWVATAWDLNNATRRKLGKTEFLPTGNLFVARNNFVKITGFDENLATNEDYDLCYRLRQQGLIIYSDPDIHVTHWGVPTDLATFYKREVWHGTHVLKVFLNDIKKRKNFRAVSYSLYYDLALAFFAISLLVFLISHKLLFFTAATIMILFPPAFLSFKTLKRRRFSFKYFIHLSVIYLVYGIARARSNLTVVNWMSIEKRQAH